MSLPDELLDELLSAHLDDALTDDERARVETMLVEDPDVRTRFDTMKSDRDAVRTAFHSTNRCFSAPEPMLESVLGAIERERPSEKVRLAAGITPRRVMTWAVALAASVLFIAWFARPVADDRDDVAVAQVGEVAPEIVALPEEDLDKQAPTPRTDVAAPGRLADANTPSETRVETEEIPDVESVSPVIQDGSETKIAMGSTPDPANGGTGSITNERPTRRDPSAGSLGMQFLMVIRVERTDQGRQSSAFVDALAAANIEIGEERPVSEALVGAATSKVNAAKLSEAESREVMLLESPMTKLDGLIQELARDRENIRGVGLSMISANDSELLSVIESVRASDPTRVRHQGRTNTITSDSDAFDVWTSVLADRDFIPLTSGDAIQAMTPSTSGSTESEDPMSNLLILVE
ncbi:MAG: hypothetical protein AAGJ83_06345 [Planctomycetota bacterium]